jgi:hypothetical protein
MKLAAIAPTAFAVAAAVSRGSIERNVASAGVADIALVASPLVGSQTWVPVADRLFVAGHQVSIADCTAPVLRDGAGNPGTISGDGMIVGHSGAGILLPNLIADRDPAATTVVLVDAPLLPPTGEVPVVPPAFLDHLHRLADPGGLLPPWSDWFGPDVMAELVPDPELRAAVIDDLPRLPLWYFEDTVTIPPDWPDFDGAYVLLSEVYRADAEAAAARGWPVIERLGGHLDIVTKPDVVADALRSLLV